MGLGTCRVCGELIDTSLGRICKKCRGKEEENLNKVMDFLRDNPGSTVEEISEGTGVDKSSIKRFIKAGKLVSSNFKLPCSICGKEFSGGTYSTMCPECGDKMNKEVRKLKQKEEERKKGKDTGFKKEKGVSGKDDGGFGSVIKKK